MLQILSTRIAIVHQCARQELRWHLIQFWSLETGQKQPQSQCSLSSLCSVLCAAFQKIHDSTLAPFAINHTKKYWLLFWM